MVADGPDARPLVKARVTISGPTPVDPTFTDESGRFEFAGLAPGSYVLTAEKTGYARTRYGSKGTLDPTSEIDVEAATVDGIDIHLPKGAAIYGRISDSGGDPIVGTEVSVSAVQTIGDQLRLVSVPRPIVETDDLGEYRIGGLPAGRYFVNVSGAGLGSLPSGMPREWERLVAWARTYYPGSASLSGAIPIALGVGEERGAVDFRVVQGLQPSVHLNMSGITALASNVVTFISAEASAGAALLQNQAVNFTSSRGGTLEVIAPSRLDPGEWIVLARQGSNGAIVHMMISGTDPDVSADFGLASGSRVAGRVVFEGIRPRPPLSDVRVDVHGAGPDAAIPSRTLTRAPVTPKADGAFDIADLFGAIELQATAPPGWTLKAIRYGDRDLLDDPIVLTSGEDIRGVQLVLTDQVATIVGSTVDGAGRPMPGCSVAVFPDARTFRFNPRRMRLQRASQNGQFAVSDLPSGSYLMTAALNIDASIWLTPDAMDELRSRATSLVLSDRERKTMTLPCVP